MLVRAADGLRVPMEHAPRSYITTKPKEVPDTLYYRRRLAAGDVVVVDPKPVAKAERSGDKAHNKGDKA